MQCNIAQHFEGNTVLGSSALLRQRIQSHEILISLFADADERDQSAAPQCATQWLTIFGCCSDLPRLFMGAGRKIFRGVHTMILEGYMNDIFQHMTSSFSNSRGGASTPPCTPCWRPCVCCIKHCFIQWSWIPVINTQRTGGTLLIQRRHSH